MALRRHGCRLASARPDARDDRRLGASSSTPVSNYLYAPVGIGAASTGMAGSTYHARRRRARHRPARIAADDHLGAVALLDDRSVFTLLVGAGIRVGMPGDIAGSCAWTRSTRGAGTGERSGDGRTRVRARRPDRRARRASASATRGHRSCCTSSSLSRRDRECRQCPLLQSVRRRAGRSRSRSRSWVRTSGLRSTRCTSRTRSVF